MGIRGIHRGVPFSIPRNDDGVWHYKIHPGSLSVNRPRPEGAAASGYPSLELAVEAAKLAIDAWVSRGVR